MSDRDGFMADVKHPGQDWESELVVFDRVGGDEAFHLVLDDGTEVAGRTVDLLRCLGLAEKARAA